MGKNHQPENWDGGSSDSSEGKTSPTAATRSCPHLKRAVDSGKLRKLLKGTGLLLDCGECQKMGVTSPAAEALENSVESPIGSFEYDNTLWLCLKCGSQLCGRAKNQHALQHYKTPRSDLHAVAMNTRSFEIWCYQCDSDIKPDSRKNLLECVEFVKGLAQKPPVAVPAENIENMLRGTLESLRPLVPTDDANPFYAGPVAAAASVNNNTNTITGNNKAIPLPPPPLPPIPGMAKRTSNFNNFSAIITTGNSSATATTPAMKLTSNNIFGDSLPRVRGLTNLGNTCFFNAVMQCLAQTPYLLDVLKESAEPGEEFTLPGGTFESKEDEVLNLPPIKGSLCAWGGLTSALAQTLDELQSGGGVFNPSKLFDKLCAKCPQFQGGDQHDSHELLRHLLESVRAEDLKRYQRVILNNLGYKDQDVKSVSEDMKKKCKIYGNQAADRILRPEQVFRGFLVSTLTCQDCYNVSSRHEYFLDMSLPVSVEKSQPPQMRRKTSPDNSNSFYLHPAPATSPTGPTKAQLKKEQKKERKAKRHAKHQHTKQMQKQFSAEAGISTVGGDNVSEAGVVDAAKAVLIGCATREEAAGEKDKTTWSASSSSAEQSDADVEDNLLDDNEKSSTKPLNTSIIGKTAAPNYDRSGNNQSFTSPVEKRDDSPENMDKDSLDEDENDSGIATSPANAGGSFPASSASNSETNGDAMAPGDSKATNSVFSLGLNEKGANLVKQLTLNETNFPTKTALTNGDVKPNENADQSDIQSIVSQLDSLTINNDEQQQNKAARAKAKRSRTQSYSDWSTTIAPRYQCEDGECSVQSCLNSFTAVELMTGNNKVGCEACTKRINGDDPKAKTVNTNATKQFLISSPPAVLILHLKRFQLGPRCMFRKLTRPVSFPMILDIAPFCGSKVKNLPNIDRKQKKLLYALYGVVEHSGSMYGGHYTAYVKVRPKLSQEDKRWKFIPQGSKAELDQDDEQRKKLDELLAREKARDLRMKAANDSDDFSNSCSSSSDSSNTSSSSEPEESSIPPSPMSPCPNETAGAVGGIDETINVQVPMGKWYYVSDSRVSDASESEVLNAQAYLLFYERIY
ncbi:ubiquitin carboxyl-terminal hydrolase 16 [Stomoxys calcitrans]|uniref:ubiquitinyl hydrolase 1 n=1 Tax=Stomoxys calcitrans TaxID=35570 RepID=A0A1I8P052_STOCA|nr:ubiquitin carboxyl-terminal hydrolase 16 [Stomoxys calcitrans]XP_013105569.1 ubiquitin carboxyl-terminal hydrolase 16 [Stomoxys calcitrans]XP_013105570.1 ubiquitin carboxyl-terminal hydrolase 16 [Stomoxys calcitrans]